MSFESSRLTNCNCFCLKNKKTERVVGVDLAKVLTMWMVIFDHIGLENRGVSDWIWTFHMPLFFLVSGLFFRSDCSFKKQIIKDVKHLLLPFLLWHIIASFSWDIAQAFYFGGNDKWSYYWENQLLFWGGLVVVMVGFC